MLKMFFEALQIYIDGLFHIVASGWIGTIIVTVIQ